MILVIDNYDSFTYNLVQYLGEMGADLVVYRNDQITLEEVADMAPEKIIISPGPGRPADAGISEDVIRMMQGKVPILGVCLGHQCIAEVYGAKVERGDNIMHGKTSLIYHDGKGIFKGIPSPFEATRYHSLLAEPSTVKDPLEVTAWTEDKEIMGLAHKEMAVWGVQFHPESILTFEGKKLLGNFLEA
ncbi:MAG: aminodeoxychorismate/anthranilate synthase component II [Candidatus Omnitrophica bacterium]|nr:aminodeoxychorismate/anthranilate synthase component II [Candidatus Omnitrophota bacterium]MDD5487468.1 aminodeoxychorismate/anthranilate synthase component II [Candidatus Omnitrophota bacterium]